MFCASGFQNIIMIHDYLRLQFDRASLFDSTLLMRVWHNVLYSMRYNSLNLTSTLSISNYSFSFSIFYSLDELYLIFFEPLNTHLLRYYQSLAKAGDMKFKPYAFQVSSQLLSSIDHTLSDNIRCSTSILDKSKFVDWAITEQIFWYDYCCDFVQTWRFSIWKFKLLFSPFYFWISFCRILEDLK